MGSSVKVSTACYGLARVSSILIYPPKNISRCGGIGRHNGLAGCQRLSSGGSTHVPRQKSVGSDIVPVRVRPAAASPIAIAFTWREVFNTNWLLKIWDSSPTAGGNWLSESIRYNLIHKFLGKVH